MTQAFSDDLPSRVLTASRDGFSARSAAVRFGIGISTAIACIASARAGRLTPAMHGRRGDSRLDFHEDFIVGMMEEAKDITLNEMVLRLHEERAVSIGRSALDVWLRKRGWTKKKTAHAMEQERPDHLKRRQDWCDGQLDLDPARLVFIDETGLSTKMSRLRGRPPGDPARCRLSQCARSRSRTLHEASRGRLD